MRLSLNMRKQKDKSNEKARECRKHHGNPDKEKDKEASNSNLQGRPRLEWRKQNGYGSRKTLTNEEDKRRIIKKNAMKEQANDVFEICSYVDGLEKRLIP